MSWDILVNSFLVNHRLHWLTFSMSWLTWLGDGRVVIPLSIGVGLWLWYSTKSIRTFFLLALTPSLVGIFDLILKELIARPRPTLDLLVKALGYSFPSGHTALTVFYFLLAKLFCTKVKSQTTKIIIWIVAISISFLVGFSRIYLGVHWLSDVLIGWCISIGSFIAASRIFQLPQNQTSED